MRTVLLASLRHNTRRYVASALAVIIGVAFIVTTEGLAGALRSGMTADIGKPYEGVGHVVQVNNPDEVDALLEAAEKGGFAAVPNAQGWNEATVADSRREVRVGVLAAEPELRWQTLLDGAHPTRPGEVLLDERLAAATEAGVGDEVTIGSGPRAVTATVTGISEVAVGSGSDLYLTWSDLRPLEPYVGEVLWDGPVAVAEEFVDDAVVWTADEFVVVLQSQVTAGIDVIALLVSFFAAVALGVAVLVIANTFAILFAQRTRDFALLRCVGVTRRQLRRSIRIEALTLGVVSSALGVAVGMGLSLLAAGLIGARWEEFGSAEFRWWLVAAAAAFGVLVSVVAAWLPTRTATRVAPLAALRPAEVFDVRSGAGRLQLTLGVLLLTVGGALLARAVQLSAEDVQLVTMVAGGGAFFTGLLLFGPVTVPALVRLVGRVASRGRNASIAGIAAANAVRNPRRTATTTASLMVGVTLTVAMLTGLGVTTEALDVDNDREYPLDAVAVAEGGASFDTGVVDAVRGSEQVADVLELRGLMGEASDVPVPVVGLGEDRTTLRDPKADPFAEAEAVVSWELVDSLPPKAGARLGEEMVLDVRVAGETRRLAVSIRNIYGPVVLVPEATLAAWTGEAATETYALWVRAAEDADAGDLETELSRATGAVPTALRVDFAERAWIEAQLRIVTGAVIGLLSIGVVIALIGIVNTLGLSVLERTRENALLRAMGLTRGQLRRVLAVEGALLAGVASLLGVAVGVLFAWVGVKVIVVGTLDHTFAVPFVEVLVILVAAVAFGMLASVLPARQAGRVSPAAGLTAD